MKKGKYKSIIEEPIKGIIEQAPVSVYNLILKVNGQEYSSSSEESLEEAFLGLKPPFYKTRGVLEIAFGNKKASKLLNIMEMKRLFSQQLSRIIVAKQLKQLLK